MIWKDIDKMVSKMMGRRELQMSISPLYNSSNEGAWTRYYR